MKTLESITTRANLYLWLLTGRHNDFYNPALNLGIVYRAGYTPEEVTVAREFLQLQRTDSDFYVLGALAPVFMSTALLRGMPPEFDSIFVPGMLSLPPVTSTLPMLSPDGFAWPYLSGQRAGKDGFLELTFTGLSATKASVTLDGSPAGNVDVESTAMTPSGYRWHFVQGADFGVLADFQSVDPFGVGETVTVTFSPTRYPYAATVERLRRNSPLIKLMTEQGVMGAFAESSSAAEKVGLLSMAIIRRMLREMETTQNGYSVTVDNPAETGQEVPGNTYAIEADWLTPLMPAPCDPDNTNDFHA